MTASRYGPTTKSTMYNAINFVENHQGAIGDPGSRGIGAGDSGSLVVNTAGEGSVITLA